jgi:hypothetical protein
VEVGRRCILLLLRLCRRWGGGDGAGGKALGSEGMVAGDARKQDGSTPLGVLV